MPSRPLSPSMLVLAVTVAHGSGRSPPPGPSCTRRTRPGRSVTKSLPSGARSTAHGARSPDATSCTFSTTAGPILGDAVAVGLEVGGEAVVGIGIVVTRGDGGDAAGDAHDARRTPMSRRAAAGPVQGAGAPERVARSGPRARLPVRCAGGAIGPRATRPVNGSR